MGKEGAPSSLKRGLWGRGAAAYAAPVIVLESDATMMIHNLAYPLLLGAARDYVVLAEHNVSYTFDIDLALQNNHKFDESDVVFYIV